MWITRSNHLRMSRLTILGAMGIPQRKSVIRPLVSDNRALVDCPPRAD
ncbi:MAG TPA: hypothetical protein VGQ81_00415 [Acidobacteriota bacterium]|jgi:hypothetical protein|nr:hypothetical protein [Acidobacteriota bacterium]